MAFCAQTTGVHSTEVERRRGRKKAMLLACFEFELLHESWQHRGIARLESFSTAIIAVVSLL